MNRKTVLFILFVGVLSVALVYLLFKGIYLSPIHDIAVVSVTPSRTDVYVGNVVNITAIVKNEGSETEAFNVTSYSNVTALERREVKDLAAGAETSLSFSWNTTGVTPANYWVEVEASVVSSETDTLDNTLGAIVRVRKEPIEMATLYVSPNSSTAEVGEDFNITIDISGVADLYGWEVKLRWNATILDAMDVLEGPFLNDRGVTFFTFVENSTEGYVLLDCSLLGDVPGASGNGTLAAITFRVKDSGGCGLELYDTTLVSSFYQPIAHIVAKGYFDAVT